MSCFNKVPGLSDKFLRPTLFPTHKRYLASALVFVLVAMHAPGWAQDKNVARRFRERMHRAAAGLSVSSTGAGLPAGQHTRQVGRLQLPPGLNGDIWVHGNFAYVGTWGLGETCPGTGIKIIDVANAASPRLVGRLASYANTSAEDMEVISLNTPAFKGDLLATGLQDCENPDLAPGKAGVDLWDVTNPRNPVHLAFFDTGEGFGTHELSLAKQSNGRVFVLAAASLSEVFSGGTVGDFQLIEVTDPRNPVRTDDWGAGKDGGLAFGILAPDLPPPFNCEPPPGTPELCRGHAPFVFGHSTSSSADGRTAHVAYWDAGAIILDISNPEDVRMIGRANLSADSEGDTHSAVSNATGTVIVTTAEDFSPGELVAAGLGKELGDTWGFARIWSMANAASPVHLSSFATPHSLTNNTAGFFSAHNPQLRGNTLYLSWYSDGLRIVDISNPASPREVGFYRPKPTLDPAGTFGFFGPAAEHPIPFVWGVYEQNNHIYLSDINFGLYVVQHTK